MATYQYKAKRGPGQAVAGLLEADSRVEALAKLSRQGFFPLHIEEFQDPQQSSRFFFKPVSQNELCFFTRQLADLLDSNVPLLRALELTHEQTTKPAMSRVIQAVLEHVKGGKSLSGALQQFPRVFSPLYVNLVRAGEAGGMLSQTLARLAGFMEQEEDFRSRLLAALAYPLLIMGVGMLTVVFLMVFVVPRLSAMFIDSGQGLPWIARALEATSSLITSPAGGILVLAIIGSILGLLYQKPKETKEFLNRTLYRLPLCGPVLQKGVLARFTRTLAMLLTGGVPMIQALEVVSHVLDHPEFSRQVQQVAREVEQGESLSASLKRAGLFPLFVCQKIAIGEEANTLEKSLETVSLTYERETDRAMKLATSMLEPLMILGVGSVVGIIVIGMLLPIFQISTFVK